MLEKLVIIAILGLFVFEFTGCESNGSGERLDKKINQTIENANDKSK